MNRPILLLATTLAVAVACAPPPEEPLDVLPCTFLRRQVCGAGDECVSPAPDANACEQCKARMCSFVRVLESRHDEFTCFAEWRSRPAYPVCRFPGPISRPATPPFVEPIHCERECSPIPYPPKPGWAP
jgi:hypothetical protein